MFQSHLIFVFCLIIVWNTTNELGMQEKENQVASQKNITNVLKEYTGKWMAIPGVIGTGEGSKNHRPCILVFVVKKSLQISRKIPQKVGGYPVVIKETGRVKALHNP